MPHLAFWQERWRDRNTPWDMGRAHPGLESLSLPPAGRAYIPACGRAHEGIWLARRGWKVTAEDLVPEAIAEAKAAADGAEGIEFCVGDLFQVPPEQRNAFDLVVDRAAFCAMPPKRWADYLDAMADRLKSGGYLASFPFVESLSPPAEGPPYFIEPEAWRKLAERRFSLETFDVRSVERPGTSLKRELWVLARRQA